MVDIARPRPDLEEFDTGRFWRAAQAETIVFAQCTTCDSVIFYPRSHCPHCGSLHVEERNSTGDGHIYTFTVIRRTPDPLYKHEVPFVVAYIDMQEGFRMLSRVSADPFEVSIGRAVSVAWRDIDGVKVPWFALSNAPHYVVA